MKREKSQAPVRRGQLIAPFGVGAMLITPDGTSLVAAGLDLWFKRLPGDDSAPTDTKEFEIQEWRLQRELKVSHFRLPPDYRQQPRWGHSVPNTELTIPFLRFPLWHYCTTCGRMCELQPTTQSTIFCPECEKKKRRRPLVQVPIICLCEEGHMSDFPWREWVHESAQPTCQGQLRLYSTGGGTLADQRVACDCGKVRSLAHVTSGPLPIGKESSGEVFRCNGLRPWLGERDRGTISCDKELRASLRSASNVYFPHVRSSIYLPRDTDLVPDELLRLLSEHPIATVINIAGGDAEPAKLRELYAEALHPYTDEQVDAALEILRGDREAGVSTVPLDIPPDTPETQFRRSEYDTLCRPANSDVLRVRNSGVESERHPLLSKYFDQLMLVDRLRETRVFIGFTRLYPEGKTYQEMRSLLWRDVPPPGKDWLPAYVVHGEGIFLRIREDRLRDWEARPAVQERAKILDDAYAKVQAARKLNPRHITPRFIMLHTLAHLLMNRLTFECGYSSAALRERLYVSDDVSAPMAGILIYTASGDAEGTMGGLVRMGKPEHLEPALHQALLDARWCSADPVCMEMAQYGGQGPDSCNLAACHNCALVPETACEEFNRFLDRGLVVGDPTVPNLGFFGETWL